MAAMRYIVLIRFILIYFFACLNQYLKCVYSAVLYYISRTASIYYALSKNCIRNFKVASQYIKFCTLRQDVLNLKLKTLQHGYKHSLNKLEQPFLKVELSYKKLHVETTCKMLKLLKLTIF